MHHDRTHAGVGVVGAAGAARGDLGDPQAEGEFMVVAFQRRAIAPAAAGGAREGAQALGAQVGPRDHQVLQVAGTVGAVTTQHRASLPDQDLVGADDAGHRNPARAPAGGLEDASVVGQLQQVALAVGAHAAARHAQQALTARQGGAGLAASPWAGLQHAMPLDDHRVVAGVAIGGGWAEHEHIGLAGAVARHVQRQHRGDDEQGAGGHRISRRRRAFAPVLVHQ